MAALDSLSYQVMRDDSYSRIHLGNPFKHGSLCLLLRNPFYNLLKCFTETYLSIGWNRKQTNKNQAKCQSEAALWSIQSQVLQSITQCGLPPFQADRPLPALIPLV